MDDYPSLAEGNGLENRQAGKTVQGFESLILRLNRTKKLPTKGSLGSERRKS